MTLETERTLINVNGVSVPGILRNGAFISESPIRTQLLYRSGAFTANQAKTFIVEFPSLVKTVLCFDTNNNTQYNFTFLTAEGVTYTAQFSGTNVIALGNTKVINSPEFVLDKGTRVTLQPNNAIQGMAMFCDLAYNIDIKDF